MRERRHFRSEILAFTEGRRAPARRFSAAIRRYGAAGLGFMPHFDYSPLAFWSYARATLYARRRVARLRLLFSRPYLY